VCGTGPVSYDLRCPMGLRLGKLSAGARTLGPLRINMKVSSLPVQESEMSESQRDPSTVFIGKKPVRE
jgi:hypothetical protein